MDADYEILDGELKKILGSRYEDKTELFTPEAQEERRNNRLMFTLKITLFMLILCRFLGWMVQVGMLSASVWLIGVCVCMLVIGYNVGVCVSHNKGWRG